MSTEINYFTDLLPGEVFFNTCALPKGYQISNHGRVLSTQRVVMRSNGKPKTVPNKILSTQVNPHGYECVTIREEGKAKKTLRVHRLVAMAFIPHGNPGNKLVNHKDGNKLNNHKSNLEWCDHSDNLQHAYDNGLRTANTLPAIQKRLKTSSYGK